MMLLQWSKRGNYEEPRSLGGNHEKILCFAWTIFMKFQTFFKLLIKYILLYLSCSILSLSAEFQSISVVSKNVVSKTRSTWPLPDAMEFGHLYFYNTSYQNHAPYHPSIFFGIILHSSIANCEGPINCVIFSTSKISTNYSNIFCTCKRCYITLRFRLVLLFTGQSITL